MNLESIFILASAGTTFVKLIVDAIKLGQPDLKPIWTIIFAFVTGIAVLFLLLLATGQEITNQSGAAAVLAGLLAAGGAIGVTGLHNKAREDK